ncbi:MAG TPA: hypothetical protein VH040_07205 [Usitatibacter sp.]|jgi:hypothetical protein|nr:hypothetical protein [Usitatibacter sp.]
MKKDPMHSGNAWHAEGLRWIANLLADAADFLERPDHEPAMPCHEPDCVGETRLRAHLRGF